MDGAGGESHDDVEQLLLPIAGQDQRQGLAECRGDANRPQACAHHLMHQGPHILVGERFERFRETARDLPRDLAAVVGGAEPPGGALRGADRAKIRRDHRAREEVIFDEGAENPADPLLAGGHDGGMGDWDAQGMAKQGGHRKPVGEAADQRGLGGGTDVPQPGMGGLEGRRGGEDRCREGQQTRCPPFHHVELRLPGGVVGSHPRGLRDRHPGPPQQCRSKELDPRRRIFILPTDGTSRARAQNLVQQTRKVPVSATLARETVSETSETVGANPEDRWSTGHLAGDPRAFGAIVDRYQVRLLNFINRTLGDHARAEDLVQEVFIRVFRHLHRFDRTRRFSTWIYTIASNLMQNELRNRRRSPVVLFQTITRYWDEDHQALEFEDRSQHPETVFVQRQLRERVDHSVRMLPEHHRVAFVLREIEGKSYQEIADIAGCSLGTVKSRLNRARRRFAEIMGPMLD